MAARPSRPFPTKPLPPPKQLPEVEVYAPLPLQPTNLPVDTRRRTLKRPISQKDAFAKVFSGSVAPSTNDDEWWNEDDGEEYYEYANAAGEIIEPDGAIAVALWDFNGEREADLHFKKGDHIIVIQRFDNGWWEGEHNGVIGDFPCNYVEVEENNEEPCEPYEKPQEEKYETPPTSAPPYQAAYLAPPTYKQSQPASSVQLPIQPRPVTTSTVQRPNYLPSEAPQPRITPIAALPVLKPRSNTAAPPLPPKPSVAPHPPLAHQNSVDSVTRTPSQQIQQVPQGIPMKEGFLTKKGHKRRNWKVRYFVLQKEFLAYYKNPGDFLAKRKPKGVVCLKRSTMVRVAPEMKRSNCFTVSGGIGLLYITAPTGEEMVSWMENIANAKAK